jgi:hypothetical protein
VQSDIERREGETMRLLAMNAAYAALKEYTSEARTESSLDPRGRLLDARGQR